MHNVSNACYLQLHVHFRRIPMQSADLFCPLTALTSYEQRLGYTAEWNRKSYAESKVLTPSTFVYFIFPISILSNWESSHVSDSLIILAYLDDGPDLLCSTVFHF